MKRNEFWIIQVLVYFITVVVLPYKIQAAESDGSIFIIPYFKSYHFDRNVDWNEDHPTIGAEYIFSNGWGIGVMNYSNSVRNRSTLLNAVWTTPFESMSSDFVKIGFHGLAGVICQREKYTLNGDQQIVEGSNEVIIKPFVIPSISFLFGDRFEIDWSAYRIATALVFKIKL